MRNAYKILAIKPQRNRPLGTPKLDWILILKWFLEKVMYESVTYIE